LVGVIISNVLKIVESNYHTLILAKIAGKYRLRSKRFLWLYITKLAGFS